MISKFRAWDKKRNVIFKDTFAITESGQVIIVEQESVFDTPDYVFTDDLIIMQSTCLFDKNGKEIFEGDIVIAWSQGVKVTFEIKRRIDGLWLLYPAWKDGQFWYLSPTEDGRETIEIIGNIYENHELLEG